MSAGAGSRDSPAKIIAPVSCHGADTVRSHQGRVRPGLPAQRDQPGLAGQGRPGLCDGSDAGPDKQGQTKQAAPLARRRRIATSGPGYQACTFTAGQGIRLSFLRRQILLDAFCLGRLPRLVARGYPVAVRGPCGPYFISTTDRSSWEDLGVINS